MKPGDMVQRSGPHTGGGRPCPSPPLTVVRVGNHNPIDGPKHADCIVFLNDGSWEFIWNLKPVEQASMKERL